MWPKTAARETHLTLSDTLSDTLCDRNVHDQATFRPYVYSLTLRNNIFNRLGPRPGPPGPPPGPPGPHEPHGLYQAPFGGRDSGRPPQVLEASGACRSHSQASPKP